MTLIGNEIISGDKDEINLEGDYEGIKQGIFFSRRPSRVDDGYLTMSEYVRQGCDIFLTSIINEHEMRQFQQEKERRMNEPKL